jgi:hypothetical protein
MFDGLSLQRALTSGSKLLVLLRLPQDPPPKRNLSAGGQQGRNQFLPKQWITIKFANANVAEKSS